MQHVQNLIKDCPMNTLLTKGINEENLKPFSMAYSAI